MMQQTPEAAGVARRTLDLIDSLAAEWAGAARPVEFRIAKPHELDGVFRLRYRTIVAEGWARPQDFPDGRERDRFDADAIHIVGVDGPALAGISRLILPRGHRPLPTEEAFELAIPVSTRLADLGRLIVAPDYRDRNHRIFAGLLGRAWLEGRSAGIDGIVGTASADVIERYDELGLRLAILGPPRRHWGQERFPVSLDVRATAAALP